MQSPAALRKLLRLKALQHDRLERAVGEKQAALRRAQEQAEQAEAEQARCEAVEAQALERRSEMLSSDFVASGLQGTNLYLGVCARNTAQAATATSKAQAEVAQHAAALAAAVALLDRNTELAEQLQERLAQLLLQQAELAEEAESDEAGELAAVRISARQRSENAAV